MSNPEWLDTICKALDEATIPQCYGHLAEFNSDGEVESKCALGVISCETGVKLNEDNACYTQFDDILETAGVPKDKIYDEDGVGMASFIYQRNDRRMSFKDIATALRDRYGEKKA